jgi:hypothetical protein
METKRDTKEGEIWVTCKYSKDYEISSIGRIYSYKFSKEGMYLHPSEDNHGYLYG